MFWDLMNLLRVSLYRSVTALWSHNQILLSYAVVQFTKPTNGVQHSSYEAIFIWSSGLPYTVNEPSTINTDRRKWLPRKNAMRSSDQVVQIPIGCSTSERWWWLLKPSHLGYFTLRILVDHKRLAWMEQNEVMNRRIESSKSGQTIW